MHKLLPMAVAAALAGSALAGEGEGGGARKFQRSASFQPRNDPILGCLDLSDEQVAKVSAFHKEYLSGLAELAPIQRRFNEKTPKADREAVENKVRALKETRQAKVAGTLSAEQRARFDAANKIVTDSDKAAQEVRAKTDISAADITPVQHKEYFDKLTKIEREKNDALTGLLGEKYMQLLVPPSPRGTPSPPRPSDPTVALIEKSGVAFTGRVKSVAVEEMRFSAEEAAAINADANIRRLSPEPEAGLQVKANKAYHVLVCQVVVDDLIKGDALRGSVLKTWVAVAEGKDLLAKFDIGWAETPAEGKAKWEAEVAGGRVFALKANPDGLSFLPVLMDFPADTAEAAAQTRRTALGAICKAYRGKPGFALPETLTDEDILARLHAAKVEKLDGGKYRLTYDFAKADELKDWYVINPLGEWAVDNGWLVQSCNESNNEDYMALVLATCAGFSGDVDVTVKLIPVDNDCLSVHIAHYCRQQTYTFLMNSDYGKNWEARRVIGRRAKGDQMWSFQGDYDPRKLYTINMGRKGKAIYVKMDGKLLFTADDEVLTAGSVALGCKGQEGIRYDSVVIEGRFDGRWSQAEPAAPIAKHPGTENEPGKPKPPSPEPKPPAPEVF